jgi:hypothetical protein
VQKTSRNIPALRAKNFTVQLQWTPRWNTRKSFRSQALEHEPPSEALPVVPPPGRRMTTIQPTGQQAECREKRQEFQTSRWTKYLKEVDHAAPGPHIQRKHGRLSRKQGEMLVQFRTGYSRLNFHLHSIKRVDWNRFACGARETTRHYLPECLRSTEQREQLPKTVGNRSMEPSFLPTGYQDAAKDELVEY